MFISKGKQKEAGGNHFEVIADRRIQPWAGLGTRASGTSSAV